jgi:hypothetical protein
MVNHQESPVILYLTRYGLPIIVLLFYITASLEFEYTPESTYRFQTLAEYPSLMRESGFAPSPLWQSLVAPANWFSFDPVRAAKILSMIWAAIAIISLYLLAVELGRDRLLALFAALPVALQLWILQFGPSGSALALGVTMSLTVLFFLKRGWPVLAAFLAGLCTLVFWQSIGLLAVVFADLVVVSRHPRFRWQSVASVFGAYGAGVLPWMVYASVNHLPFLPVLLPVGYFPPSSVFEALVFLLLLGLGGAGIFLAVTRVPSERIVARDGLNLWLWMIWLLAAAALGRREFFFPVAPLLVVYAFLGVRILLRALGRERLLYTTLALLCGLMLLQQQVDLNGTIRPFMEQIRGTTAQLRSAAIWLRTHTSAGETVATELPWVLRYDTDVRVMSIDSSDAAGAEYLVTSATASMKGYIVVYEPLPSGRWPAGRSVAVWRKQ